MPYGFSSGGIQQGGFSMGGVPQIFILIIAFVVILGIIRYIKNSNSPIVATRAKLIDKNRHTHTTHTNGSIMSHDSYELKFELDTGSTMSFNVNHSTYHDANEGEWGTLTFQGTRFLSYTSTSGILEK